MEQTVLIKRSIEKDGKPLKTGEYFVLRRSNAGLGEYQTSACYDKANDDWSNSGITHWYEPVSASIFVQGNMNAGCEQMIDYILKIDAMTTKEFCENQGCPLPIPMNDIESSANQFLQIDAIKHRLFVSEAKRLRRSAAHHSQMPNSLNKMHKPIVVEQYADNGEFSHWHLIDPHTGSVMWSSFPEETEVKGQKIILFDDL